MDVSFEPLNEEHVRRLRTFLEAPERAGAAMTYPEVAGFLFAVACSPELVKPSEWLPAVFGDDEPEYRDAEEAQSVLGALMSLYNFVNEQARQESPGLPPGIEVRRPAPRNFGADAPLGAWARGFGAGHDWLSRIWDEYTPDELDQELGADLMALTFFAGRDLAEGYRAEIQTDDPGTLDELAGIMLEHHADARASYANLSHSIRQALAEYEAPAPAEPVRREKTSRNEPCPCGSGRKYKKCCGAPAG